MFSVVKVGDGIARDAYRDPGALRNPPGTVAYEWTGEAPALQRSTPARASTPKVELDVRKPGVHDHQHHRCGCRRYGAGGHMYELYIANRNYSSWSLRPWVLMRSLGIPFTERLMPFSEAGNWEAFRAFSPSGEVPCLRDGAVVVWDSLAIAEYVAERHPGVWPADAVARAWARCAAAEMHAGFAVLRDRCSMTVGQRVRLHEITAALHKDIERIDELWREGLRRFGGPFLAGSAFTAVDAFFAPVAFRIRSYALQLSAPALEYAQRLLALPAMREWEQAALRETWREAAHEADVARHGEVLEDLRAR